MHDLHKVLFLMSQRDVPQINEGFKTNVVTASILGGTILGALPSVMQQSSEPVPSTPQMTPQTPQTPSNTPAVPVYDNDSIKKMVIGDEGIRLERYKDTKNISTIGIGHNLESPGSKISFQKAFGDQGQSLHNSSLAGGSLTEEQVKKLFDVDYDEHLQRTIKLIPKLHTYPSDVQSVLVSGTYRGHIGDSPTFRKHWNSGNYDTAMPHFLDRDEYKNPVKKPDGSLVAPGVITRLERDNKILSDYAKTIADKKIKDDVKSATTSHEQIKESYKNKIRAYLINSRRED